MATVNLLPGSQKITYLILKLYCLDRTVIFAITLGILHFAVAFTFVQFVLKEIQNVKEFSQKLLTFPVRCLISIKNQCDLSYIIRIN